MGRGGMFLSSTKAGEKRKEEERGENMVEWKTKKDGSVKVNEGYSIPEVSPRKLDQIHCFSLALSLFRILILPRAPYYILIGKRFGKGDRLNGARKREKEKEERKNRQREEDGDKGLLLSDKYTSKK